MIFIKRITGESFDLETGSQLPKNLVLSNGTSEVSIPVTDEVAMTVVQLMAGAVGLPMPVPQDEPTEPEETPYKPGHVLNLAKEIQEVSGEYDDPDTGTSSI